MTKIAGCCERKELGKKGRAVPTGPGPTDTCTTPAFPRQIKSTGGKEPKCQEPVESGDSFSDTSAFMSKSPAQIQLTAGHQSTEAPVGTRERRGCPSSVREIPNTDTLKVKHTLPFSYRPPGL